MDHNIQLNIDISGNVLGLFAKEKKSLKKNFKNFHLQTYQKITQSTSDCFKWHAKNRNRKQ